MGGFSTIWGATYPLVTLDPASDAYPAGRHVGNPGGLSAVDTDLVAANIIAGVTVFGIAGTHGWYDRWLARTIAASKTAAKRVPERTNVEPAPISSSNVETVGDLPGSMIKQLTPAPTVTQAAVIAVPDYSEAITETPSRKYDLELVLGGAVADDGGVQTTETAAAQNATVNDMTLLPAVPALSDAYYFGSDYLWDALLLNIGTQGAGTWTISWEYWNGGVWAALGVTTDAILGFKATTGIKTLVFTRGAGWATTAVNGITKYWIRAIVSAYTSVTTQPKGTQAWYRITT